MTFAAVAVLSASDGGGSPERRTGAPGGEVAQGRALFARMGCGNCHRLAAAGSRGGIGPDLDERLPAHTRATLTAKIVDPYPDSASDQYFGMPEDFAKRMSAAEIDALVTYMLATRGGG